MNRFEQIGCINYIIFISIDQPQFTEYDIFSGLILSDHSYILLYSYTLIYLRVCSGFTQKGSPTVPTPAWELGRVEERLVTVISRTGDICESNQSVGSPVPVVGLQQ